MEAVTLSTKGMRTMKEYITPQWVRTSRSAIAGVATLILLMSGLLVPWAASAKNGKDARPESARIDYGRIEGKWLRPDGGYVLVLSDVKSEGTLKAAYFNPEHDRLNGYYYQAVTKETFEVIFVRKE
jgi:hypothetical protein